MKAELLEKEEKLQLVAGEVTKLKKLVAKKQKENEKSLQDFEEKTEKLKGFLTARAKEIEKCKENERTLRVKEEALQEKVDQLNATMDSRETKVKEMEAAVAEAKEKLKTKEHIFAEKIKKMQQKLDAALCPSTDNDQLESDKSKSSINENLRNQLAELNRKLLESKKSAEEYLRINKEAVCSLKIQEDAKATLEARMSTLKAQHATQTKTAELARIQWEQTHNNLKDKLKCMEEHLSAKEKQICEMKKDLTDSSSKVQLFENHIERLITDLESARVAVNDLSKKAEQAEKVLKLKNYEFLVLRQRNKVELTRHKEKEKISESNINALRAELQELRSSKEFSMVKLQEKVDRLNATVDSREAKLKEMEETVAEAKEKLKTKDNIFTEKVQKMKENLDAVLSQSSTYKDQLEVALRKSSINENLRNQLAELNRKLLESKKSAEEYLQSSKDAVCKFKMLEDAKVALEARMSALEAQLTKQTGKAELDRIQWEQSCKGLE